MSIRSLPSIRKVYRLVSAVSQVYQRFTQKDTARFHGIFDSYIISFQPLTFPLPDLWHAHRPNITLPEKCPTLFPCSHLFAFLYFLTGPNIPYQRSKIHRGSDGSGRELQWGTGASERKSSIISSLWIYSVSKCGTSCFLFYKIVLHLLITIISIDPFTLLKHQHSTLIRISSTILRIHIIHTIMHTYKAKNVLYKKSLNTNKKKLMKFWSEIVLCALLYIEYVQDYNSGCPATSGNNLTSKTGLKSLVEKFYSAHILFELDNKEGLVIKLHLISSFSSSKNMRRTKFCGRTFWPSF